VEQDTENHLQNVIAIIPARYSSARLPGKMLREIAGKPLILHTLSQVQKATTVSRVIVATDDERILNAVSQAGGEAVMTSTDHASGSDRIAEVAEGLPQGSIIVNVQGDEPLISSDTIDAAVETMRQSGADIVTVCEPLTSLHGELLNFNVVKVVCAEDGRALYFSRSPMPFPRDASLRYGGDPNAALQNEPELWANFRKHTGLYVYSREYLLKFAKLPPTRLEKFESLEQIRALENGAVIKVVESVGTSIGVDTAEDFDRVRLKIEFPNVTFRQGTVNDIPAISEAYLRSVRGSFTGFLPAEYLDGLSVEGRTNVFSERRSRNEDSYRLLIAEDRSAGVVGFIDYAHKESENFDHDGRIFSFYLVPEFQRRGIGGLLFRQALRRMRGECYGSVCLDTFEANPYRAFYEKLGGRAIGSEKHEGNGQRLPTVVYGWEDLSEI
jgi:3-deoxy-manno-octulosonate cytidylyltransferase (CMP-KDO synthetase)